MANSEYIQGGAGSFASLIALDTDLAPLDASINFTRFRLGGAGIQPGMAAMVDDEIMLIESFDLLTITVKRGCADTLPAMHLAGALVWIFDVSTVGSDQVERSAGEIIGVKVTPFTIGGGAMPSASVNPLTLEFKWRYFRPYPPAKLMVNAARWLVPAVVDEATPALSLSWAHRDRVLQADTLVGHDDDSIGPEPGTTYTLRIYTPGGALVRTEVGLVGTAFNYQIGQALYDQGFPADPVTTTYSFTSRREDFDAWQGYIGSFTVHPVDEIPSLYQAFAQRVIESPYTINLRQGVLNGEGDFALAMAARPSDRMADTYDLIGSGSVADATEPFTPWATLDFRLPELETTLNLRTTSLYDGIALDGVNPNQLALIDDEIIEIVSPGSAQQTVRRGCLDTVPAVHIAGSRVWYFDAASSYDALERTDGETIVYTLRPDVYGPPIDIGALPQNPLTFARRAELPYAPGRVVVNGRPWFEEAQALAGVGTVFSWARRNRTDISFNIVAHEDPDMPPEVGQITRLRFYYETPSLTPGEAAVVHVLRDIDSTGVVATYDYALAVADGNTAGTALGVCGTVVIYCRMSALRDGLESLQSYVVPIRVPSYPC